MIFVTGGTGFVGNHLVKGLNRSGHRVRILVRNTADALMFHGQQVEAVLGNVTSPRTLEHAIEGCEAVIHLVGIIQPSPGYSFKSIHVDGTRNVVEAAKKAEVRHLIYQSALGTGPKARSNYHRTKYEAEQIVKKSGLDYTITRPSIIYGRGDGFTTRMVELIQSYSPVVPVIGSGKGLYQPVYIDDLVSLIVKSLTNSEYYGKTLSVCGPERLSLDEFIDAIMATLRVDKPKLHIPTLMMRPVAAALQLAMKRPPVTNDQITMLLEDNICDQDDLKSAGIAPIRPAAGLKKFLI